MLETLLGLVAQGGLLSYDELAQKMGVPRPLLEAMIEDLARRGYLSRAGAGAACGDCAGCGVATRCGPSPLWTLTDKGAHLAGNR